MTEIKIAKCIDPRINFATQAHKEYVVVEGATTINYQRFPANSDSTSNIVWNIPPPSLVTAVARTIWVHWPIKLVFQDATTPANAILEDGRDAFRANPISNLIQTLGLQINSQSTTVQLEEVIPAFSRFYNGSIAKQKLFSMFPSALDPGQVYSDWDKCNSNPLGNFRDRSIDCPPARGAYNLTMTMAGGVTTVTADLYEMLMISPLCWSPTEVDDALSLLGVQQFVINMTLVSNPGARIWSHSTAAANGDKLPTPVFSFNGKPELLFNFFTLPPERIPLTPKTYPYFMVQSFTTDAVAAVAHLADTEFTGNIINLNSIPNSIYVWAQLKNVNKTITSTDTNMSLQSMNIRFGNKANLFAGLSQMELYNIARRNGVNMTFTEWAGLAMPVFPGTLNNGAAYRYGPGSVFKFDMTDLGSDFTLPGGVGLQSQIQVQAKFKNISGDAITPTMYVCVVYEGIFNIYEGQSSSLTGIVTPLDVVNADTKVVDVQSMKRIFGSGVHGAGFLENIGSFITSALPVLRNEIIPTAAAVANFVKDVVPKGRGYEGGSFVGGKGRMSLSVLKKQL